MTESPRELFVVLTYLQGRVKSSRCFSVESLASDYFHWKADRLDPHHAYWPADWCELVRVQESEVLKRKGDVAASPRVLRPDRSSEHVKPTARRGSPQPG